MKKKLIMVLIAMGMVCSFTGMWSIRKWEGYRKNFNIKKR